MSQSSAGQMEVKSKGCITEIVDDRDDTSEAKSEQMVTTSWLSISGKSNHINVVKMLPDEVVWALEGLTKEECGDILDQILLKGEDF